MILKSTPSPLGIMIARSLIKIPYPNHVAEQKNPRIVESKGIKEISLVLHTLS
jgi:hypothetical protein